jgi:hypothetical protein
MEFLSYHLIRKLRIPLVALIAASMMLAQSVSPALAASFTVTTTADSGPGSLRAAIEAANATSAKDTIKFNIPGAGPHIIEPAAPLPNIVRPVIIDGTTQPTFPGTMGIYIRNPDELNEGLQLFGGSNGSTIKGLAITGFDYVGLHLGNSSNNIIQGNYLGTEDGITPAGNGNGLIIDISSNGNLIGGTAPDAANVISGNTGDGITVNQSSNNIIQGNRIGTDPSGTLALANGSHGIVISSSSTNTIGGTQPGAGNIISANAAIGIHIEDNNLSGPIIQGNIIGMDVVAEAPPGNGEYGIVIDDVPNTIIGGTAPGAGNMIAAHTEAGIEIYGGDQTLIQGNVIGDNGHGLRLLNAPNVTVGGAAPDAGNEFVNNHSTGITIDNDTGFAGVIIERNAFYANAGHSISIDSSDNPIALNTRNCFEGNGGMITGAPTVAENNWWGDPSGPTHATNPDGTGDMVYDNIDFMPWAPTSCSEMIDERVANGGFEVASNADLLPDYWMGSKLTLSTLKDGQDCTVSHAGQCSFRLVGSGQSKKLTQTVNVSGTADETIILSLYTRRENVPAGGTFRITVTLFYTDGSKQPIVLELPTGSDLAFNQTTAPVLTTTRAYNKIEFKIEFTKSTGTVWLDDVSVIRVIPE